MPNRDGLELAYPNQGTVNWDLILPVKFFVHRVGRGRNPFTKAVENWVDPAFVDRIPFMLSKAPVVIGYWRLFNANSGRSQADIFCDQFGSFQPGFIPCADIEHGIGLGDSERLYESLVFEFMDRVSERLGVKASMYANGSETSAEGRKFWDIPELTEGRLRRFADFSPETLPTRPYDIWQWGTERVEGVQNPALWNHLEHESALLSAARLGGSMVEVNRREDWTSRPPRYGGLPMDDDLVDGYQNFNPKNITSIAVHYTGSSTERGTDPRARLRNIQANDMDNKHYFDIMYNLAASLGGEAWYARGIYNEGAAQLSGNFEAPSVLVIAGVNDLIPPECIEAVRACVAAIRNVYPSAKLIRPHQFWVQTACPGQYLLDLINQGAFEPTAPPPVTTTLENFSGGGDLMAGHVAWVDVRTNPDDPNTFQFFGELVRRVDGVLCKDTAANDAAGVYNRLARGVVELATWEALPVWTLSDEMDIVANELKARGVGGGGTSAHSVSGSFSGTVS